MSICLAFKQSDINKQDKSEIFRKENTEKLTSKILIGDYSYLLSSCMQLYQVHPALYSIVLQL